jgi:Fur family ferric uptake transcriptional regulator
VNVIQSAPWRERTAEMTVPHAGATIPAPTPAAALAALQGQGLRVSAARRLVLDALYTADEPVTAERIADGLDGLLPRSDLASVYRNLETLEAHGIVRHFHLGHGPGRYAPAGEARDYIACEGCGALRAVDPRSLAPVREYLLRRFGLSAGFSHFPIVGHCSACGEGP